MSKSSLFDKLKKGSSGSTSPNVPSSSHKHSKKDAEPEPETTPLAKMLQNAGPIRNDGSDKFFGFENFGNTCYCNSVMQALYYSVPFREHVVRYPPHSPIDTPDGPLKVASPKIRVVEPTPPPPSNGKGHKGITAGEAMRRRTAINAGQPVPATPGQRPEDKPDSPEYKKKHAMLKGPVLDLTYENASSYGMEESTFTAMKDIFMALISNPSRTGVLSPQRFLEIFRRDNEMFRTSMHQDAHEFYGLVLNAVISNVEANAQRMEKLKLALPMNGTSSHHEIRSQVTSAAHAMGLYNGSGTQTPGTRWVHEIFEGVLTSETKCLTCENASQRDETFLDLSIDLEEHSSVTSCLRKFSAEEMLCERNKFHCDNCGGLQEAEKRMKIKRLPKILALHLKRFKYTEDMTRLQKLFHRVVYPYYLRMFNTTDDAEDPDRLYELYAVVVHIGGNAYHGHYVSVIKTQDRGWLLFDDEMVEPVDKSYVRNFFGDKPGQACAYVLFYQQTTEEAMRKDQDAEELAQAEAEAAAIAEDADMLQANGAVPSSDKHANSVPSTPIDEIPELPSIDQTVSAPIPTGANIIPHRGIPPLRTPTFPSSPIHSGRSKNNHEKEKDKKGAKQAKEAKDREKKEAKEAEKAKKTAEKAAAKEKQKAEEQKQKDAEQAKKDFTRQQTEEAKKAIAAAKQAAADEEARRKEEELQKKKEAAFGSVENGNGTATNGHAIANGHAIKENDKVKENGYHNDKGFNLGGLSRKHIGSKSMSRRSFAFLGKSYSEKESRSSIADESSSSNSNTAVDGESGPQTPEKHTKTAKDRFSFAGLGRKKSNLTNT